MTAASLANARRTTDAIEGWLKPKEGPLLYELARTLRGRGTVVEIGSWKGKSTTWLALGLRDGGHDTKVHAVDPHTGSTEHQKPGEAVWTFAEFERNVQTAGVADLVTPIVKPSVEAAASFKEPVELLWVDGAHEHDAVVADIEAWRPHLVEGAVVAFHDSDHPDVTRALHEHIYMGSQFVDIRRVETITWCRKVARASSFQRLQNRARLAAQRLHDAALARQHLIPAPLRRMGKAALRLVDPDTPK